MVGSAIASQVQSLRLWIGLAHTGSAEACRVSDWLCDFARVGGRGEVWVVESCDGEGGRGKGEGEEIT